MRPTARALAVIATSTLALVGLAAPAHAASPAIVTATPAPGSAVDAAPSGVSIAWDQSIAITSTITVSGPAGASPCTKTAPVVAPGTTLSCSFSGVPSPTVPDGTYTVSYTANSTGTDPATSGSYDFVVDTTDPAAPTGLTISPDPYNAASGTLTVTGSTESSSDTVEVTLSSSGGGTPVAKTVSPSGGTGFTATYSAAEVAALGDGTLTASATSTDRATNTGPAATDTAAKDTVDPALAGTDPAGGGSKRTAGFTYAATGAEPLGGASAVAIFDSTANQLATTKVVSGPTVTVTPVSNLPEGTYLARIGLVDAAGNAADLVDRSFTIDNTAPAAPVITTPAAKANLANGAALPLAGTGEAGATVTLTISGTSGPPVVTSTTVAPGGAWSTTADVSSLPDGALGIAATQADGAGNASAPPASTTTTKDTVKPRVTGQAVTPSTLSSASTLATVTGKVDNGTTTAGEADAVTVSADDAATPGTPPVTATGTAAADGTFSVDLDTASLGDGTITYTITATDDHANPSTSVTTSNTKDTAAPSVPGVDISPKPVNAANRTAITVSGASDGTTVDVVLSDADGGTGDLVQTDVPVTAGSYSTTFDTTTLSDGTLTASVTAQDPAGNTSPPGSATALKDTVAPTLPTVAISPDPVNAANQTTVTVSGSSNGDTVDIVVSDGAGGGPDLTSTATVSEGSYSQVVDVTSLADGPLTATVIAEDTAGNSSGPASDTATKDTLAPGQPASLNGSPSPYLPTSTTFTVSGTSAAGDSGAVDLTVDVTVSDGPGGGADLAANDVPLTAGSFTTDFTDAQVETLADGPLTLTAVVSDPAGNAGPARTASAVKDTTVLDLVSTSPAPGRTVQPPATVSATYNEPLDAAASTITVSTAGGLALAGTTSVSGPTITFTPSSPLSDAGGPYTVSVQAVDAADGTDTETDNFSFGVDGTAPTRPTITSVTDPVNNANKTSVAVSGNAGEAGLTVTVTLSGGGTVTRSATSATGGAYTVSGIDVTSLADGPLSVTVVSEDGAGNDSPVSDPAASVKDTLNPTGSTASPADGSTVLAAPSVTVTFSESLGSGEISIPGVPGSSSVSGATVTFTPTAPVGDGTYTATATVIDPRGNPGAATTTFTVNDEAQATTTSLDPLPAVVVALDDVVLSGTVSRRDESSAWGPVRVGVVDEDGDGRVVGSVTPAADGRWSLTISPTTNGTYTASYLGDAENTASASPPRTTQVRVLISASSKTGPAGKKAKVKGSVSPTKAGAKVRLYRVAQGTTTLIGTGRVAADGRFKIKLFLPVGRTRLEVAIRATPGNLGNSVRLTAVRT